MLADGVAGPPVDTSQFFGHKDAIGVCNIVSKGGQFLNPKLAYNARAGIKIHGTRFETHPGVATLLGFIKQMLEQLFRHALAPVRRGRAHRFYFCVLRVEFFDGTTTR